MKKDIKYIVGMLLLSATLTINSVALAAVPSQYSTQTVIEGVTGRSTELKRLDGKIRLAEDKWIDADHDRDEGSGYGKEINKEINPLRREIEEEDLRWQRKIRYDELITDGLELYYKTIVQEQLIEYQKAKIERLQKQVEIKKIKISVGTEAAYTLVIDETALKDAETELQSLIKDQRNIKIQLNIKMGNPVRDDFTTKDNEIPYEDYTVNDIDYVVSQLLKNSYTITSIDKKVMADVKERDINESYRKGQSDKSILKATLLGGINHKSIVESLDDDLLKLKYDMKDEQDNLESRARNEYNNVLNLKDEIESQKLEYEKNVKISDAELIKFKAGQSVDIDYKKAQEDVKYALYQCTEAKYKYYIAVQRFKDFIKYGVK